ncbi:hypothetical protein [Streptomyces sp. SID1121]|uniref:hypothetical protein n=1 Tax=Streptomyces sp. SID1121 TaxID=3425888 RepID=UPI004057A173
MAGISVGADPRSEAPRASASCVPGAPEIAWTGSGSPAAAVDSSTGSTRPSSCTVTGRQCVPSNTGVHATGDALRVGVPGADTSGAGTSWSNGSGADAPEADNSGPGTYEAERSDESGPEADAPEADTLDAGDSEAGVPGADVPAAYVYGAEGSEGSVPGGQSPYAPSPPAGAVEAEV